MKTEDLVTGLLYVASAVLLLGFAYPMYNGGGYPILSNSSNVIYEIARNEDIKLLYTEAVNLKNTGVSQATSYTNIDSVKRSRIETAVPLKMDVPRVINDLDKIANKNKMIMVTIGFSKIENNSKYPSLNVYNFNLSVQGSYSDFRNYIKTIEDSLQIYNIKTLAFSRKENQKETDNYTFAITLEAYELK